jgi:hypothetical protein
MDVRRPVASTESSERPDPLGELRIATGSSARRALTPRVVPAGGDAQEVAHRGDPVYGSIPPHESERFDGAPSASLANQAAAFFKISRSSRSWRFSRRRRVSSARSSVVRPSRRPPSSRSACLTQARMTRRRARTSARDSGSPTGPDQPSVGGTRRVRVWFSASTSRPIIEQVSTKPGQLHTSARPRSRTTEDPGVEITYILDGMSALGVRYWIPWMVSTEGWVRIQSGSFRLIPTILLIETILNRPRSGRELLLEDSMRVPGLQRPGYPVRSVFQAC